MAFYTICGKPDCKYFAHATYVAQYLCEKLPNFKYRRIEKSKDDWPDFVNELNNKNSWYVVNSPIIWKEISTWGGKPYLIGALGEFWEYCYCYYGLESFISKSDLEKLATDNLKYFEEVYKNTKQEYNAVISILGSCGSVLVDTLIREILTIPFFTDTKGCFIKLYDEKTELSGDENKKTHINNIVEEINSLAIFGNRTLVEVVDTEEDAIKNCDLLIFLEDYSRENKEENNIWMQRSLIRITNLSDTINVNGKRELKVIFSNEGPRCFMATCMLHCCTVLIPSNIVALTADEGLSVISIISELSGVPVSKIGGPPVWGFVGINQYIDETNIIFKGHIYKPYKRTLTAPEKSTLPLGTIIPELRLMSYLLPNCHEEITRRVTEKKNKIISVLHRKPNLSKIRALISLLQLWYADQSSDDVISLGVCSNGSYGIPPGLVFSQPCIQDQKRRWQPFSNFPLINEDILMEVKKIADESIKIIQSAGFDVDYCIADEIEE